MKYFFEYNWQIRAEWFDWCKSISNDELYKKRIGGVESIAHTLFHIIKVEYDWICDLQDKPIVDKDFKDFNRIENIVSLSKEFRVDTVKFRNQWTAEQADKILNIDLGNDNRIYCTHGEAIRHIIAHEIHHIGQLSIWARAIGIEPISANFIHKGIIIDNKPSNSV
jgi:uncharacterized damage-inducible protein DinB